MTVYEFSFCFPLEMVAGKLCWFQLMVDCRNACDRNIL